MFTKLKKIYFLDFTTHKTISHATTKYLAVNALLFLVPLFLGESQILVGSIVNLLLIYIALNFKQAKLLPAIFLPAIASILRNTVLGSATVYLAVLLPFIWMANGIFIMAIRGLAYKWQSNFSGKKLVLTLGISAVLKSLFLFSITFTLVSLFEFPSVLLVAMGLLQLATASIASVLYLVFSKAKN
jgi:hypothetical protein